MAVEKRNAITCFALTDSEKRDLINVSEKVSKRMSDYIRDCVLKQMIKDNK